MTLALVAVVCLTLLVLQREGLKYLREYHGTAKRLAELTQNVRELEDALGSIRAKVPSGDKIITLERRVYDIESILQAQRIVRK